MAPGVLSITRFGLPRPDRFTLIEDDLVPTERRLMTELPSSREDFALFLAQRDAAEAGQAGPAAIDAAERAKLEAIEDRVDLGGPEDVYGAALPALERVPDILAPPRAAVPDILADPGALTAAAAAAPTATSVAIVRPEAARRAPFEDAVILAEVARPLAQVLADRWVREDLPALAQSGPAPGAEAPVAGTASGYRLLDAVYSAAIRDGASAQMAGELVAVLAKRPDLDRPAEGGERVRLAFARRPGSGGTVAGQWLYVGVASAGGGGPGLACYILPDRAGGFVCRSPGGGGGGGAPQGGGQFVQPVAGIIADRFGPRLHPILMMGDYHPDFVAKMSRAELLALRGDPTLATEMVKRLAQENETCLRARGHAVTSGWLYLAHFLGPEGAHRVRAAEDGAAVVAVMGEGVVAANPFLRSYTVADLKAWATRKMDGPGAVAPVTVVPDPPEVKAFIALADQVLEALGGAVRPAPRTL
ncbi:hypothetical protein C8J30_10610 [Rhodobacter viridis]|uniref:Uncharacterized protein n=1 Tax=Rhodobacter viridis TaxID=1054202 RepID=A0A318TZM3_9RHOB|nr:hypothetical protein [Rhodobacter viridis]PYF09878.1 hypothetical protein C8J30_10610 [Rhodobacter viridis]